jgi:hypothetical protein
MSEEYTCAEQKSAALLTQGVVCQRGGKYDEAVSNLTQVKYSLYFSKKL